jgi:uridine kinase
MNTHTAPLPMIYGKRPDDLECLSRSRLLAGLAIQDLGAFFDALDQVALPPGTSIFREGEEGDCMYFVLEGEAHLRRGQLELRPVRPGDHFGELAMLSTSGHRAATVEADTTMRLARLSRRRYLSLATTHPRLALHFTQALAASLGEQLTTMTDNVGLLAYTRSLPRRTQVDVHRGADELFVGTGTLAGTLLPREHDGSIVVGATINLKPVSLETAIVSDVDVGPLTLASWEGRAIYRRSVGLLVLEAARRVAPGAQVSMGPTLDNGQVVVVGQDVDRAALARSLGPAATRLVQEDLALREEVWATDEARAHLSERGWTEAAALLAARREATVTLLSCGETFALGLGPVVPRASYLGGFSFGPHPDGILLRFGAPIDRHMPPLHGERIDPLTDETTHPRYGGAMSAMERRWLEGMGVTSVGGYNERCVAGRVPELIRVAEGFHEKWIGRIADDIASRRDRVKVIVIAGPSSSGKTTFIKRLTVQLVVNGIRPLEISLDDYYVDRDKTVLDEDGEYDFEAFEAIDAVLLQNHLRRLLGGERVNAARYDFVSGKSYPSGGSELTLEPGGVLVLEGIHGLNPALLEGVVDHDSALRVFVHPATTLPFDRLTTLAPEDVRLVRRIVRDRHARNYTAAETILRWPSVRRGELCHIFPHLRNADLVFDSALVYEMSVLKTYAERYLLEVPPTHPAFTTAYRLRNVIDQFVAIYPDHVPPTSVLREFTGGSGFEY